MTREEILELSKREKTQEYEKNIDAKCHRVTITTLAIVYAAIVFLSLFVYEEVEAIKIAREALIFVLVLTEAISQLIKYSHFKKTSLLVTGIFLAAASLAIFILFIVVYIGI